MLKLDKIILGHNPLFGVDHLNQARGNDKQLKFENKSALADVLRFAHSKGIKAMMMSTHPRAQVVLDIVANDPVLRDDFTIYPLLPYIVKYVRQANEKGMMNLLLDILSKTSMNQKFNMMFSGVKGVLGQNVNELIKILIDIEMLPFKGHKLGAIFLHDALTDLAVGLGTDSVLDAFRDHVESRFEVPAGLITKNVPLLRSRLDDRGWSNYLIMASFNKTGFFVNPSLEETTREVKRPGMYFIPMSTMAAGAISPDEAFSFLGEFETINSVVVGMSQKKHISETVDIINKYIKN